MEQKDKTNEESTVEDTQEKNNKKKMKDLEKSKEIDKELKKIKNEDSDSQDTKKKKKKKGKEDSEESDEKTKKKKKREKEENSDESDETEEDIKKKKKKKRNKKEDSDSSNEGDTDTKKKKKKMKEDSDDSDESDTDTKKKKKKKRNKKKDSDDSDESDEDTKRKKHKKRNKKEYSDDSDESNGSIKKKKKKKRNKKEDSDSENSDESKSEKEPKSKKNKHKQHSDEKEESEENESQKSEDEKTKGKKDNLDITDYPHKESEEEMNQIDENSLYQNNSICKKFIETKDFLKDLNNFFMTYKMQIQNIENIKKKYDNFNHNYGKYIGLLRFSIPIIGKISSGKSTFLNYIHDLKTSLQINSEITTKFICIIRHNKDNIKPRIFHTKTFVRGDKKINFLKGEEIKEDINEIIEKRNSKIANNEIGLNPLEFFLIIEANLPIFNDKTLEQYSDIFEFMDVPGLNEISEKGENIDSVEKNFYFKEIIPIIIPNVKFFILMFDAEKYNNEDSKEIITKLYEKVGSTVLENSLYIVNKIDILKENKEEENELLKNFIGVMEKTFSFLKNKLTINYNVIGISAKKLLANRNKYKDFRGYIEGIIVEACEEEKRESFSKYLCKKFKKDFYKKVSYDESDDDSEEDFPKKLKDLSELISSQFNGDFTYGEYQFYKKKFKKYIKQKNYNPKKDEYEQSLFKVFQMMIIKTIKNFEEINQYKGIKNEMKEALHLSYEEGKSLKNNMVSIYLQNIKMNPKIIKNPMDVFQKIGNLIDQLSSLKGFHILYNIRNKYQLLQKYLNQERALRFLLVGGYSSGKSTLLNTLIIGQDILPVDAKECTKIGIILKHCNLIDEMGLYSTKFIENREQYFYFDYDLEHPLAKSAEDIKSKIKELNNASDTRRDISFYLIKIPLKLYDYIKIDDNLKSKIEFLDFPGLDTKYETALNSADYLLKFTNGFLFIQGLVVQENSNKKLLGQVIESIKNRNSDFSFKCCLFVINKCDQSQVYLDKAKKMLENLIQRIQDSQTHYIDRLSNDKEISNSNEINFTKFSSLNFQLYLKDYELIIDMPKFFEELFKSYNNRTNDILEIIPSIQKDLKNKYFKIKNKDIQYFVFDENEVNKCSEYLKALIKKKYNVFYPELEILIENISKYYIYIKENTKNLKFFINSNAGHFLECLTQVIMNSNKFYNDSLKSVIADYCINFGDSLNKIINSIYSDSTKIDPNEFTEQKKKIYLDAIEEKTKMYKMNIKTSINSFNYQLSIYKFRNNMKKTRNEFNKIVEDINKENKIIMDNIQKNNIETIEKYQEELKKMIKDIQQIGIYNMKKYKDTNKINFSLDHHNFEKRYYSEENLGLQLWDNGYFVASACIPVVNYISYIAFGLTTLIDWARGHEKEFEEFITNYEKNIKESLSNYEFNTYRQIDKLKKESIEQIENIFAINGKDIDKIQNNKDIFKNIGKAYEMLLSELIASYK